MANRPDWHHAVHPPARALYARDESAVERRASDSDSDSDSDSGGSSKSGGRLSWVVWIILATGVCTAVMGVALGDDESQDMPPRIAVVLPTETPAPTMTPVPTSTAVPTSTPPPTPTAADARARKLRHRRAKGVLPRLRRWRRGDCGFRHDAPQRRRRLRFPAA